MPAFSTLVAKLDSSLITAEDSIEYKPKIAKQIGCSLTSLRNKRQSELEIYHSLLKIRMELKLH